MKECLVCGQRAGTTRATRWLACPECPQRAPLSCPLPCIPVSEADQPLSASRTRDSRRPGPLRVSTRRQHDIIGLGIGRLLLANLIAHCEALGLRQMVAAVGDSANVASVCLQAQPCLPDARSAFSAVVPGPVRKGFAIRSGRVDLRRGSVERVRTQPEAAVFVPSLAGGLTLSER
jgi:hypothetical protein